MCVLSSVAVHAGLIQLCCKLKILLAQRCAICKLSCQLGSEVLGLGSLVCPLRPQLPALLAQAHKLSMLLQSQRHWYYTKGRLRLLIVIILWSGLMT